MTDPRFDRPLVEPPFVTDTFVPEDLTDSAGINYRPEIHFEGFELEGKLHVTKCEVTLPEVLRAELEESIKELISFSAGRVEFETQINFKG